MPNLHSGNIFDQIVLLLILATIIGGITLRLRQPLIIAYIIVGILAGPSVFGWVSPTGTIQLLAELGLTILLFLVGLRLDLRLVRSSGPVALAVGVGQVILTTAIGFLIAWGLGLTPFAALFVGVSLSFSSTIIAVKLLSDKRETDSLHGRIAVGILIVQDILVILIMIILTGLGGFGNESIAWHVLRIIVSGVSLLFALWVASYVILPRITGAIAKSTELLVLFAIAWAVALAALAQVLGLSREIGAFLAGVSLASLPYRDAIGSRLISLRDFLLLFFFIDLGSRLNVNLIGTEALRAIPLSIFVLIGKPLIMIIIMGYMGYRKRSSFLTGVTLAQVSEFSLILAALGLSLKRIGVDTVGLITLVAIITIGISTYLINYSQVLYDYLSPYLTIFQRRMPLREYQEEQLDSERADNMKFNVILFGIGRYGSAIAKHLTAQGRSILGVDFDPQAVKEWNQSGKVAVFGDTEDPEFPSVLPLAHARWVISSIRELPVNLTLLHALQTHGFAGSTAATAHTNEDAGILMDAGARVVFVPFADAAAEAADMVSLVDEQERKRRVERIVSELRDHYIICGYGRMGQQIVKDFRMHNVPHVVVEHNKEQIPKLIEQDVPYVEGNASEDNVLKAAGIERAKGLIAVTATDEENVFIVLTARGLNQNLFIVARSILLENEDKLRRAGADRVVSPYVLGGRRISSAVINPQASDFLDMVVYEEQMDLEIAGLTVSESSPLAGKTIGDARIRQTYRLTILAIRHADGGMIPNPGPEVMLKPGDEIYVMGTHSDIESASATFCG